MSDSDDTDVLLLIPPNFFTLKEGYIGDCDRENLSCFGNDIVENLVSQVSELETRVSLIENFASPCSNKSVEGCDYISSMVLNEIDLNTSCESPELNESTESNINLISPSLTLKTDLNSNTESAQDLIENVGSKSKSKEAFYREIDQYLSNVETIKLNSDSSISVKSDLDEKSKMTDMLLNKGPVQRLDLPEVDKLLKEMEATQSEIESKLRRREIEYGLGSSTISGSNLRKSASEDKGSNFDRISGFDDGIFSTPSKYNSRAGVSEESIGKRDSYFGSIQFSDCDEARKNSFGLSNQDVREINRSSCPLEARRRFLSPSRRRLFTSGDTLHTRKSSFGGSSVGEIDGKNASGDRLSTENFSNKLLEKPKGKGKTGKRNDLLSLAELWKNESELNSDEPKKLRQKLEEEKLRRTHLENTIQELQRRVLEEQEKLAVAVKVDEGKDRAISQITEAWKQMVNHWRDIEAERHNISQTLIKEKASIKQAQEEMNRKIERWEKEVSQALDLAAGFKSKCEFLESELVVTKETNEERLAEVGRKLRTTQDEIDQLTIERKTLTEKLNISEEEHRQEKKLVELAQNELQALQEVMKKNETELAVMKEQRDLLSLRLKEEKGRTATLEQQKTVLQESLEEMKKKLEETEESLVNSTTALEKVKSEMRAIYQSQLETVVKEKLREFQSQLDAAQTAMAAELSEAKRQAQERALTQQQALVNSHVAEMRRLEALHKEEVKTLESKLAESERRRERLESGKKEIAHRLHGVMETQWQQALSIITSELSIRQGENGDEKKHTDSGSSQTGLNLRLGGGDELPFSRDGQMTNRVSGGQPPQPVKQDHLLKYIQMLLEKQPGKPVDSSASGLWPDLTQSDTLDDSFLEQKKWSQDLQQEQTTGRPLLSQRKPPWK